MPSRTELLPIRMETFAYTYFYTIKGNELI